MTQVKKRWSSMDVLRTASFVLILLYHFMVEIEAGGFFSFSYHGITYETSNLHMAKIGVVLFFMMSGFGLMSGSVSGFSGKEYTRKRFVRILIPYYAVSFFVLLCALALHGGDVFPDNIPKWRIVFTVLGLDGYLKEYGISTFHLGVGEWFIGCLILMYFVFPFLRRAMIKTPDLIIAIATVCYLLILIFYNGNTPIYYFFPVKLYDFILGMYLAMKLKEPSRRGAIVTGILLVIMWMIPIDLPLNEDYPNVIFGLLLFLCVYCLEDVKPAKKIFDGRIFKWFSGCSYEMFLIHHWAIIVMNRILSPQSAMSVGVCLIAEVLAIVIVGSGLHYFIRKV